jgi:hypothetical protein
MLTRCCTGARGAALRLAAGVAAGLVVCLAAGVASAQSGKGDYIGRWSVAGAVGYAVPNTDEYGNVLSGRVGVWYSPFPAVEIGLEAGLFSSAVSQPEPDGIPDHDIASGVLDVIPVCLTLQYRVPIDATMASLLLLGGAGYYLVDYTMDPAARAGFASRGGDGLPDQSVRDAWGFHLGAGLEYAVTGWLSLTAEARYLVAAPKVSGTAADDYQLGGSLDLNTWLLTGGMKVAF